MEISKKPVARDHQLSIPVQTPQVASPKCSTPLTDSPAVRVCRAKLHSTHPIERLNGEIKRRTELVGIFPNDDDIIRLVGAILIE